jgi:hypothetical protein
VGNEFTIILNKIHFDLRPKFTIFWAIFIRFSEHSTLLNHELPNLSITNILQYLSIAHLDTNRLYSTLNHFKDQVSYVSGCWENFSFDQFSPELLEPLIAATQHEEEYIGVTAMEILNVFMRYSR